MSHKIIACRVEHCLGCKSCEIACALEHSQSKDIRQEVGEHPLPQRRVTVEVAGTHGLPLQCRHCEDGLCQIVCPTGAIHHDKKRSVTVVDEDLCIGCKLCTLMCPMGVLRIGEKNRATIKCDQCMDRQAEGQEPACVAACPTHALRFVDDRDIESGAQHLSAVSVVTELTGGGKAEKAIAKVTQPLERMFTILKERLEPIPTRAQRQAAIEREHGASPAPAGHGREAANPGAKRESPSSP